MSAPIELRAPAKLNLHLGIYPGRDERGYHLRRERKVTWAFIAWNKETRAAATKRSV